MYLEFYTALKTNYHRPQYFPIPTYYCGSLITNPIILEKTTHFPTNSFYSCQTEGIIQQNSMEEQKPHGDIINLPKPQRKQREDKKYQVCKKKAKSSTKRKNKKIRQKDDRNVASNLLKIFFKNLLDLHKWDDNLKQLIQKSKIQTTPKRFYLWINSFSINYKIYIKSKEIRSLLVIQDSKEHQYLFRRLLKHFIHMEGLCHSLTARRIDKLAIRRHVEGLREIEMLIEGNQN